MARASEELEQIKQPWARSNKFKVFLNLLGDKWSEIGNSTAISTQILFEVTSISLPDMVDTPLEEYLAEQWMISRGRRENFIITLQLRAPADMSSYSFFMSAFKRFERIYPKEQYAQLIVQFLDGKGFETTRTIFQNCLLVGVSGARMDYSTENGLIDYSLTFKTGLMDIS
jgi:hypothetical protein